MAGRETVCTELLRKCDEIDELHALVAARAWHGGATARIFVDETVDYAVPETAFIVEHVMRDAEAVGDLPGVVDILPGATRTCAPDCFPMIVKLECDPYHFRPGLRGERGRDGTVDAARHGNDDSGVACGAAELKIDGHGMICFQSLYPNFTPRD
jgi:hypothetical protein